MDLNKLPEDVKPTWSELLGAGIEGRAAKPMSLHDHIGYADHNYKTKIVRGDDPIQPKTDPNQQGRKEFKSGPQEWQGVLLRDEKQICPVTCANPPINLPAALHVSKFLSASLFSFASPQKLYLQQRGQVVGRLEEWKRFLTYLRKWDKIAVIYVQGWELFLKPAEGQDCNVESFAEVCYCSSTEAPAGQHMQSKGNVQENISKVTQVVADSRKLVQSKAAQMHPDYLQTLRQTHNSWIFGGIAELVDNARDANATRLEISVKYGVLKGAKSTQIPMLCVEDNGTGMNHEEMEQMVSFGHKRPEEDDPTQIGRFGVGFKTGAMKLGKDVVVFTQGKETRSIALLSSSFNEGKHALEVPVVTYHKQVGRMEYDQRAQPKEIARENEKAVIHHSPFDKYGIGHELSKFNELTGTRIYIYNLEKWGSEYCLLWDDESSTKKIRDIKIRSKRVRSRPGQTSHEVPLDYSLHAYLEVMFLEPKMIINVQGSQVKTRRLAKSLNRTEKVKDIVLGKEVELTLGRSQVERDRGNCGIFMYWHGRLIEAYKRVGNMIHSADWGRGVIGVMDTTSIMEFGKGRVGVLNSKQGFEDSEAYAVLESWLGKKSDEYWEAHEEDLEVRINKGFTSDLDWVQCNKCLKWRVLKPGDGCTSDDLPDQWFCYMPPFKGSCKTPEEKVEPGVITISTKRSMCAEKMPSEASGVHTTSKGKLEITESLPGRANLRSEVKAMDSQSVHSTQSMFDDDFPLSFVRRTKNVRSEVSRKRQRM